MTLLLCGVLLFTLVHLVPSLGVALRTRCVNRLGENGYKAGFSLLLVASFALMILGWRSAQPTYLYAPPAGLRPVALALMVIAFILLAASSLKTRIKRWIRHPQLTGVALWAAAHLLLNGDSRSLLLFGGLGAWAVVSMFAINRRDGAWTRPPAPAWYSEGILLVAAFAVLALTIYAHPWISGMPVL
jgi:uncharacterized membrane protein